MKVKQIQLKTHRREELLDVTGLVREYIDECGLKDGIVVLYVPHTTAAVTINENADPSVTRDIIYKLNKEIPQQDGFHHSEGNSDAHIKSSLVGASLQVLVADGAPVLGTWQGLYFCEFDGPRSRKMYLKAIAG